ncbi:hypothetical protein [Methanococcus maripaludis]|uniref:S-layer protein outer domain-containing protein n=1 Tax=Methanococcus maripaludis TaxID=39152 RepID=A0A8T4CKT7_METMI|nr:hypothetical protein [Methanococcus maripaludis]MBM7408839.1 hypothetical protein [Methanococcus maripaludis]MBP2218974.1 hypothetical protein [Methanococcus maripaludis]
MKKFLILAMIALSLLVSVSAEMDYNNSNYYGVINESGIYVLSEDIPSPKWGGILINTSNVVLDGGNHYLICNNGSEETYGVDIYPENHPIENITIKNIVFKNWTNAIYADDYSKNVTIINCEFEDNEYFLNSSAIEQYFYLNTIHENQSAESYAPLASPKLVYTYGGNEYTYRLGNYYVGYAGTETDDEGVYNFVYDKEESFIRAFDIYPLIKTPENYKILKVLYPESDSENGVVVADIFALANYPENYVIKETPVTTPSSPHSSSGGRSYDSDISDEIGSKVIKNFVSSAAVIYGNEIDQQFAEELRERIQNANGYKISGNAVIVGGPNANGFAREYNNQFEMPISNDYPGENRGVIQVLKVQDNTGKIVQSYTIVYIAGSDRRGTQAALEYFKTLNELPDGPIMIEWTENGPKVVE